MCYNNSNNNNNDNNNRYDPRVQNSSTFVEENGEEDSGLDRENTSMPDGLVGRQQSESSRNISAVGDRRGSRGLYGRRRGTSLQWSATT